MNPIEARILMREKNSEGVVHRVTGQIGGVIFQAEGFGSLLPLADQNKESLGFRARWASGKGIEMTPQENIEYIAERVARSIADVSRRRGFTDRVDMVRIDSASAPFGIENKVRQILQEKHNLSVGKFIRDSLACNGTVYALTEAAQAGGKIVVTTVEHLSPGTQHDLLLQDLFGDGVASIAFQSGDLSVLATQTLFQQDTDSILTIPHRRMNTLPPEKGRTEFVPSKRTCRIIGESGSVFEYKGGVWQPLAMSPADVVTMKGLSLLGYFANATPEVMKKMINEYIKKQGEDILKELNPYGVIHQPSKPVLDALVKIIGNTTPSTIYKMPEKKREGKTESILGDHIQHVWTPTLEKTTLDHNNVSGATTVFSLIAMIEAGLITRGDVMFTGMGVGNNITSTIFRFNEHNEQS